MNRERIERLAREALAAAIFYEREPGLAGPQAIIDLYRTVAILAGCILGIQIVNAPGAESGTPGSGSDSVL